VSSEALVAFTVFFDTCAIYGAGLVDLLLTMAEKGLFRPLWSDDVLGELTTLSVAQHVKRESRLAL